MSASEPLVSYGWHQGGVYWFNSCHIRESTIKTIKYPYHPKKLNAINMPFKVLFINIFNHHQHLIRPPLKWYFDGILPAFYHWKRSKNHWTHRIFHGPQPCQAGGASPCGCLRSPRGTLRPGTMRIAVTLRVSCGLLGGLEHGLELMTFFDTFFDDFPYTLSYIGNFISSQLTKSNIYRGVGWNHQPVVKKCGFIWWNTLYDVSHVLWKWMFHTRYYST